MSKQELVKRLASLSDGDVVAEFADQGEGGNVTSPVVDVVVENGRIVLITDHAI